MQDGIGDDKNITGFIVENTADNGISMNEEEHKLGIRASSTRQVFFNETNSVRRSFSGCTPSSLFERGVLEIAW